MITVDINLPGKSYDVLIGPDVLEQASERMAALCPNGKAFIAADKTALDHHETRLVSVFKTQGIEPVLFPLEAGETIKTWAGLQSLVETMLDAGMERQDCLFAFGGGTTGDLAGLAASLTKRGTRFVQIPTTLLAQVDSSVGGKTAINTRQGKNLAGAFYQPDLVLADTSLLATLPQRENAAGLAEIIKAGAIGAPELFEKLETVRSNAFHEDTLPGLIADAVRFKARIVAEDEKEHGVRALLNLGHTFAHAFEAEAQSGALLHGEAVAFGMVLAYTFSEKLGHTTKRDTERMKAILEVTGLPAKLSDLPGGPYQSDRLYERMTHDKKNSGGQITLILTKGIGKAYIDTHIDEDRLRSFLKDVIDDDEF